MSNNLPNTNSPCLDSLILDITQIIENSKNNIQRLVNAELVLMYWNVGKKVKDEILKNERAEYGKELIPSISKILTEKYGRGYTKAGIFRMIQFYEVFPDEQIVATLSRQLTWSHLIEIIPIENEVKREFYITMTLNQNWSVRVLRERIDKMLFERTLISKKPELAILNDLEQLKNEGKMSTDLFFRDPYILDFLNLKDVYSEKDLENAILSELEKFILEFGKGFSFVDRQKRIQIDNEDYYIDLLFYHRKLKRLVVIELKIGKFKPEHKGQVELYLKWLDKYEKELGEESPIGIILCSDKGNDKIELLELDKSNIHVSQYLSELPSMELLKQQLEKSILSAKIMLEQRKGI